MHVVSNQTFGALYKDFIGLESLEMAQKAYDKLRDIWPDNGMPTERGRQHGGSAGECPHGENSRLDIGKGNISRTLKVMRHGGESESGKNR